MGVEWHGYDPPEQTLVAIGDIVVTPTRVITPSGERPVGRVGWTFTDMTVTRQEIPTWAIVCAVVFALFCLLGLLFLLVKEERTGGVVVVAVRGEGFYHATQLPVGSRDQVVEIGNRVNYARSVGA